MKFVFAKTYYVNWYGEHVNLCLLKPIFLIYFNRHIDAKLQENGTSILSLELQARSWNFYYVLMYV